MSTLYSIGEVLIDFVANEKGKGLDEVEAFTKLPGGAPANVAAAVSKYGYNSSMITKVGKDGFGDFLIGVLKEAGVKTDKVFQTTEAPTGLAFVSLKENGEREFAFYRKPSADLLLQPDEIGEDWFAEGDLLHFCSVDLVESPMKYAHVKAIELVKKAGGVVSFDPNIRLPLWDDAKECQRTVREFLPKADILKISDEELEFITDIADEKRAIQSLFTGDVKVVVYTKGSAGAEIWLKDKFYPSEGYRVEAIDTTGAGDAFIGGFLAKLMEYEVNAEKLEEVIRVNFHDILRFANASGALTTTRKGAISGLPTVQEMNKLMFQII